MIKFTIDDEAKTQIESCISETLKAMELTINGQNTSGSLKSYIFVDNDGYMSTHWRDHKINSMLVGVITMIKMPFLNASLGHDLCSHIWDGSEIKSVVQWQIGEFNSSKVDTAPDMAEEQAV